MAKRVRTWDKAKYERYLKEGRGQGEGQSYRPWISVHDFSSQGTISRIAGHKTRRVHHFLSRNELNYFYLLEWSETVLDIREQYPLLDVALAADVAREAGIRYPRDNISGFPYVMTCDFMVTTREGLKARTIKYTTDLRNPRTVEKLEIERRYWACQGVDWRIVTEREIPVRKCRNIAWLYTSAVLPTEMDYAELKNGMQYETNSPPSKKNKAVDWLFKDEDHLAKAQKAVAYLRGLPGRPAWINRRAIEKFGGITNIYNDLASGRIPKTQAYLDKVLESNDDWSKRKIQWAVAEMIKEGKPLYFSQIQIRAAVLPKTIERLADFTHECIMQAMKAKN